MYKYHLLFIATKTLLAPTKIYRNDKINISKKKKSQKHLLYCNPMNKLLQSKSGVNKLIFSTNILLSQCEGCKMYGETEDFSIYLI